jgi:hypothetical protein
MTTTERDYFIVGWNVEAVVSVILPLAMWLIACIGHTSENDNTIITATVQINGTTKT